MIVEGELIGEVVRCSIVTDVSKDPKVLIHKSSWKRVIDIYLALKRSSSLCVDMIVIDAHV